MRVTPVRLHAAPRDVVRGGLPFRAGSYLFSDSASWPFIHNFDRAMQRIAHWFERLDPSGSPSRWSRIGLCLLAALIVVFFANTLHRQAFGHGRKGDLGVFFRAGWAARFGGDIYGVTDDHGWHYLYPPLLASLMMPLADPPADAPPASRVGTLPFWVSAAIWDLFNICCLIAALHIMASTLEASRLKAGARPVGRYSRAWWALRVWPLLLVVFAAGDGLGSGQTTSLLLLLLSAAAAAMLRDRRGLAGFCLGFVGMMKLFPLYMLVYPILRRDRPMLAGAAAGILLGFLLPVVLMGPGPSFAAYRELFVDRLLGEAAGQGNAVVSQELHGTNSRIQSFEYMIYDSFNPDPAKRAPLPPTGYFIAHIAVSATLTVAVMWWMRRRGDPLSEFLFFAAIALMMVPMLPVSRPHYYELGALAFAGLYASEWPRHGGLWPGWPTFIVALASLATGLLAALNQSFAVDFGLATYAGLALAAVALTVGHRRKTEPVPALLGQ